MEFYHIDRNQTLYQGQQINLLTITPDSLSPMMGNGIRKMLDTLSWNVSRHGERYLTTAFITKEDPHGVRAAKIDLIFELVRQIYFPDKLSRFQAVFGFKTMEELQAYKALKKPYNIVMLESEKYEPHDAGWLNAYFDFVIDGKTQQAYNNSIILDYAFAYWEGRPAPTPQVEYLLQAPVSVLGILPQEPKY